MSIGRHFRAFADAWAEENRRRKDGRAGWAETEFLPAALEITETPPSPVGRLILWMIVLAAATALVWAFIGELDQVAVAEGRLVPSGRLRSVEAAEQGVIRAIHVHEGQHVNAGDVLIELDPTIANADASSAKSELSTAALTRARDNALLAYSNGRASSMLPPRGAAPQAVEAEQQLVAARIHEYEAKRASLEQRRAGAEAAARSAQAEITKLERTLPILKEQRDSQRELESQGFGARQKRLQAEQAYVSAEQDLEAQRAKYEEAKAQVGSIAREVAQTREEFVGRAAQERAEAEGVVATRGEAVKKAAERQSLHKLTAPVSGTIQEVSVTTIGEVPEVGKPLITIVPDGEALVAEALLMNRDAGFVRAGMPAAIKLEAYPFTRYGTLKGIVEHVSPDATVDQKRGLVFPLRVRVSGGIVVDGKRVTLTSGMAVTVEVVTGRRRVIDYLWSPVAKAMSEAGRER